MSTVAEGLISLDEFLAMPDEDGKQEFDRGRVIKMPPAKFVHSLTLKKVYDRLNAVLEGSGCTAFAETGFVVAHDIVRQPDIAVVEDGRLREEKPHGYLAGAPLIAIEIASPSNTAEELDLKIDEYLRHGSQAVWVAYPKRKAIVRFAIEGGKIHGVEYRPGEAIGEEIGSARLTVDPADCF